MRNYYVRFTNGSEGAATVLAQPDILLARMKARELARGIMEMPSIECRDRAKWRIIIESDEDGRIEEAFPLN